MYELKDIILKFIEKNHEISRQYQLDLCSIWREVVGDVISNISYPDLLKDNTLEVLVKNATWLNQLRIMKKDIINKFNLTLGRNFIEDIEFKLDRRKKVENKKLEDNIWTERPINYKVVQEINDILKNIKDKDIKKLLKSIFIKSYTHQQTGVKEL